MDTATIDAPPALPHCQGLPATCGSTEQEDCCAPGMTIPGGTFYRSYDVAADAQFNEMGFPATISSFKLDKYVVTVGRFRQFVDAGYGTRAKAPLPGSGAHPNLASSGWNSSWDANLAADTMALRDRVKCVPQASQFQMWTDAPGANENKPMNCLTWYDAMAFCIWDGGYLPTEAEWNYAAAGGSEQRAYPWSPSSSPGDTSIDCSHASYNVSETGVTYCTTNFERVGAQSPQGDGKWGQSDLAGNIQQWVLDVYTVSYASSTCNDCAYLGTGTARVIRGADFRDNSFLLRTPWRHDWGATTSGDIIGVRCARNP
jgi:formylglycine-generating enzyme required for sulfatase activity